MDSSRTPDQPPKVLSAPPQITRGGYATHLQTGFLAAMAEAGDGNAFNTPKKSTNKAMPGAPKRVRPTSPTPE